MGKSLIVGPSLKKQHVNTSIEDSVEDMPQEEKLDVNELKGSKQIPKETMMLPSNDQDTITTIGSINQIITQLLTSFEHAQNRDNKGHNIESQNTFRQGHEKPQE